MNSLLTFLFQSVACSLVFYGLYYVLLRNESCYAFNRYYLLLTALFSLIFPLVRFSLPFELSEDVVAVITLPEMVVGEDPYAASYTSTSWLTVLYGLGILFFAAKLLAKVLSVSRLVNSGEKEQHAGYVLVRTKGKLPTFSFMKYLFWDDSQPLGESERQQILKHELAHIKKKHSLDILLMEILHAIMWFNPLMYAIKGALVMTHEFEADEKATEGKDIELYQKLLAQQVLNQYGLALGSHFNQSQTLKRLRMLTNKNANVYWGKYVLPVLAIIIVFGVISCEHPAMEDETINIQAAAISEEGADEVFTKVEEMPVPPGGLASFYTYVARELKYPAQARRMGVEGKVFVQFTVDKDGSITDIQTVKGIGAGCDMESERVIAGSPKWQAGKQRGRAVKTRMILPISFKLDNPQGEDRVVNSVKITIDEAEPAADNVFPAEK